MSATVYTSQGARAFHGDRDCRARWTGRDLNDWDVGDKGRLWVPGCRALVLYALEPMTIPEATWTGKLPCRVCLPDYANAWFHAPSEYDFGHEPVTGTGWFGEDETICARCTEAGLYWGGSDDLRPVHVIWPCTSALVLGLVSREVSA